MDNQYGPLPGQELFVGAITRDSNEGRLKILTMCQGGNSRSVAAGYLLKYFYGMDAVAIGWEKNSQETLDMMMNWADAIIVMQEEFLEYVPDAYDYKLYVLDVGPDKWFNSFNPELLQIVGLGLESLFPKIKEVLSGTLKAEEVPIFKYTRS